MDNRLNELYKQKLEKDIIQKVNDEGYEVENCNVNAHISDNDTGIELITLKLKEKLTEEDTNLADDNSINSVDTIENALVSEIQKIQKVEIGVSDNKITWYNMQENRGVTAIYVRDAASGEVAQLTDFSSNNSDPKWNADGSKIYFLSDRSGSSQIWEMAADQEGRKGGQHEHGRRGRRYQQPCEGQRSR